MVYSVFTSDFVLWNTIVKLMKVVLNSILIPSPEGVFPENFEKLKIKMVYSERILRFN